MSPARARARNRSRELRLSARARLRTRVRALRAASVGLAQTAVAAGVSLLLAHDVLGHKNAFFAPVAAVIALGISPGGRTRRTIEMVLGVAVGIAVGELLIRAIGTGAAQVGLVVLLAMAAATLLGGGPLIATQAASSAVLVATVRTPGGGLIPNRFIDALVGGVVGIAVLVIVPRDPSAMARRATAPVLAALAGSLDDIAASLESRSLEGSSRALERARTSDELVGRLRQALVVAEETTRIAPSYWRERHHISRYEEATIHLELAVRNARVLARAAVRAVELERAISPCLPAAIRDLSTAVQRLEGELASGGDHDRLRATIVAAAVTATEALNEERGFAIDVVVGQVRSIAVDLLRSLGIDQADAAEAIREAAGERGDAAPRSRQSSTRRGTGRARA
jgi:uncharacterized membrane protein YgaE (UPF0421/DUF939 family)